MSVNPVYSTIFPKWLKTAEIDKMVAALLAAASEYAGAKS